MIGVAYAAHTGEDAAPRQGDVHVARSADALLELLLAGTGEDGMGVSVHEARHHQTAASVELLFRAPLGAHLRLGAHGGDAPVDQGQSAAFDDPQCAEVRPSARLDAPGRGDLRRPDHQEVRRTLAIAHAANPSG